MSHVSILLTIRKTTTHSDATCLDDYKEKGVSSMGIFFHDKVAASAKPLAGTSRIPPADETADEDGKRDLVMEEDAHRGHPLLLIVV